ncbi:MAG: glycosyltransferase family 9 protein [Agarilytica sp.]
MQKNKRIKSILIIRITAIGDIIMASPVPTAIKENHSNTHITWVVHPKYSQLLDSHPDVDEVIAFDIDEWQRLLKNWNFTALYRRIKAVRTQLRKRKFERAIDLQGNFTTGFIAWLSGAIHKIALGAESGNAWFMTKTISKNLGDRTQIGSEYRYLVNQLGCSDSNWRMHVPITMKSMEGAREKTINAIGEGHYAVIAPFTQHPQKSWFNDYWEQIILRLRGRYQLRTLIVGGENGISEGNKIGRASGATNFAGQTSLAETASIIANASILIGVDTGLTHMGHALKVPTISLFGATHPYDYVDSETSQVIYLDRFCSPCRRNPTCNKKYQCMREITPDIVLTAIKPLLNKTDTSTATPIQIIPREAS